MKRLLAPLLAVLLTFASRPGVSQSQISIEPGLRSAIVQLDNMATVELAKDNVGSITIGVVFGNDLVWSKSYEYADTDVKGSILNWEKALTVAALPKIRYGYEPGAIAFYSNTGYAILGAALSHAAGKSYMDYVRERIYSDYGKLDSECGIFSLFTTRVTPSEFSIYLDLYSVNELPSHRRFFSMSDKLQLVVLHFRLTKPGGFSMNATIRKIVGHLRRTRFRASGRSFSAVSSFLQ